MWLKSTKMSILHLIILLVGIVIDAIIDNNLIRQKKNVHTAAQYVIREGVLICLAGLFAYDNTYALYSWILSHFIYWFFFDTTLNLIRKKPITYLSERGMDYWQKPHIVFFVLKAIFAGISVAYFFNQDLLWHSGTKCLIGFNPIQRMMMRREGSPITYIIWPKNMQRQALLRDFF